MKEIFIRDLILNKPYQDGILYVEIVSSPYFFNKFKMIQLIVKDQTNEYISIMLYNQDLTIDQWRLMKKKSLSKPIQIAIKRPYMNLSYEGSCELRNDNSANVEFIEPVATLKEL